MIFVLIPKRLNNFPEGDFLFKFPEGDLFLKSQKVIFRLNSQNVIFFQFTKADLINFQRVMDFINSQRVMIRNDLDVDSQLKEEWNYLRFSGNATLITCHVFRIFDLDRNDYLDFKEFLLAIDVAMREIGAERHYIVFNFCCFLFFCFLVMRLYFLGVSYCWVIAECRVRALTLLFSI